MTIYSSKCKTWLGLICDLTGRYEFGSLLQHNIPTSSMSLFSDENVVHCYRYKLLNVIQVKHNNKNVIKKI